MDSGQQSNSQLFSIFKRFNWEKMCDSHCLSWRNMPDGDVLLFSLIVDGHIGRLVNLCWLKYQHLEE